MYLNIELAYLSIIVMEKRTEMGCITLSEFVSCCKELSELLWTLQHKNGYDPFLKKTFYRVDSHNNEQVTEDESEEEMKDIDDGEMVMEHCDTLTFECHIVFSQSYATPVLYFNVYQSSGKMLTLSEVWEKCVNSFHKHNINNKWSFITQAEHPILLVPYFQLHPCHTAEFMCPFQDMHLKNTDTLSCTNFNYVHAWLSIVLPVIGLSLD